MEIKQVRPIPVGGKTACVCRYGAFGDAVFIAPVLRQLKKDGYYVTLNCTEPCYQVLCKNPNVDMFMIQATNEIPNAELGAYWEKLAKPFTRFINLNGSIEEKLLLTPWQKEYTADKEQVKAMCDHNYMDATMAAAGYPELKGEQPEVFFKEKEEKFAEEFRKDHPGFLVVYSMSGSSAHKTYPYGDSVVHAIVEGMPDATVVLVGEKGCKGIIDPHPRILDLCGDFSIRRSFILTRIADLVISTETAVANAASCFDTPKIVLLSHSSQENLTKYWRNCFAIEPPVPCFPCHRLHYSKDSCPTDEEIKLPVCVSMLTPTLILDKVEMVYEEYARNKQRMDHSKL